MSAALELSCRCQQLRGYVEPAPADASFRLVCMCRSCQAYLRHLGQYDHYTDADGGTDIVQLAPSRLRIDTGLEHLACLKLTKQGPIRWYARCCNSPLANGAPSSWLGFTGLMVGNLKASPEDLDRVLGRPRSRIWGKHSCHGSVPEDANPKVPMGVGVRMVGRIFGHTLRGRARPSPFFTERGRLRSEPELIEPARYQELLRQGAPKSRCEQSAAVS